MKLTKLVTFAVAGAMLIGIPAAAALADPLPVQAEDQTPTTTTPANSPSPSAAPSATTAPSSSSSSAAVPAAAPVEKTYDAVAEAMVLAIREMGLQVETVVAAEAENKTVSEYMNNAILEVPGLEKVTPVAQGGSVVLDGQASNVSFLLNKPLAAHVDYAKVQAESVNGKVMNVVNVKTTVSFETAGVNFYMPGVTDGQSIQIFRYNNGEWEEVEVTEIREDHVVVNMTAPGVLAFIEVQ